MVVISAPWTAETGVTHDRVAEPRTWTVHAPHWAAPHPNLVPLRSSSSRSTQSRGMSDGTSTVTALPLTLKLTAMDRRSSASGRAPAPAGTDVPRGGAARAPISMWPDPAGASSARM
jgi:hypothetical protein